MQSHHWLMLVVVLLIGYVVGSKFPQWGQKIGL